MAEYDPSKMPFPDPSKWEIEEPADSAEYLKHSAMGEDELPGLPDDEPDEDFEDDDLAEGPGADELAAMWDRHHSR